MTRINGGPVNVPAGFPSYGMTPCGKRKAFMDPGSDPAVRNASWEPEGADLLDKVWIPDHARLRRAVRNDVLRELRYHLLRGNDKF
jgi:hypothetical protein